VFIKEFKSNINKTALALAILNIKHVIIRQNN